MDAECTEEVNLVRYDGGAENKVTVKVLVGKCKAPEPACAKDMIQNLDITSCQCEPLPTPKGMLLDFATEERKEFHFDFNALVTLRVWANAEGKWDMPMDLMTG